MSLAVTSLPQPSAQEHLASLVSDKRGCEYPQERGKHGGGQAGEYVMPFPKALAILSCCSFLHLERRGQSAMVLFWFLRTSPNLDFYGKCPKIINGWLSFVLNIVSAKERMSDPRVTQGEPLSQKVV